MTISALLLTVLIGQITDNTTGQPLHGVLVQLRQAGKTLHAVTDDQGDFTIKGLRPGAHVLRYSSDDVPPRQITVTVRGKTQHLHIGACSTTLDYSCGGPGGGG